LGYLSPPPAPAPVIVYKDVGGLVTDYEAQTEQYRRENREVRLHECRSACTLALSLPNVCVYPDAKVKFHQAYNAINREVDYGVSAKLFASYPAAVQARLGYLTREYRVLTGVELIALGMRNCNGGDKDGVMIASRKPRAAPTAAIASAGPNVNPNPWGDIARKVQTAVASALSSPPDNSAPIRVAVVDRQRASGLSPRADGAVSAVPAPADVPLPPRRPPSAALTPQEAQTAPQLRMIAGAQPIVGDTQFVRTVASR
jgi:hypothetical protein